MSFLRMLCEGKVLQYVGAHVKVQQSKAMEAVKQAWLSLAHSMHTAE